MNTITNSERQLLRRLAGIAYDRELGRELGRLETSFTEWHAGRSSAYDVNAAIHAFHDGVARDLWVLYNRSDPSSVVARAVVNELLTESEIPAHLLAKLRSTMKFFRHDAVQFDADTPARTTRHDGLT